MTQAIYHGLRDPDDTLSNSVWVTRDGAKSQLPLCLDLRNHSPTGFEWGYTGSGPAQLALALLDNVVGSKLALKHYMSYKNEVVARLPKQGWTITESTILDFINRKEQA